MKRNATIYALISPVDNMVYYVGTTTKDMAETISNLKYYAMIRESAKDLWIRDLLSQNKTFEVKILEQVSIERLTARANFWTNKFRGLNANLTNKASWRGVVLNRSQESIERSAKSKRKLVTDGERTWDSLTELAKELGTSKSRVSKMIKNKDTYYWAEN